jgi:hypothetical protein
VSAIGSSHSCRGGDPMEFRGRYDDEVYQRSISVFVLEGLE